MFIHASSVGHVLWLGLYGRCVQYAIIQSVSNYLRWYHTLQVKFDLLV